MNSANQAALASISAPNSELAQSYRDSLNSEYGKTLGTNVEVILVIAFDSSPEGRVLYQIVGLENEKLSFLEHADDGTTNIIIADDPIQLFVEVEAARHDGRDVKIPDWELAKSFGKVFALVTK